MTQVPLAPPPPTGGPIDGWLFLLWKRLTATGQLLWSSIVPGSSADVAAVVTDETGSPGSLVFSGNPTLTGLTVSGAAFTSRGITDNATATALIIANASIPVVGIGTTPKTSWTTFGGVIQIGSQLSLIGNSTGGGGQYNNSYYDGTERFIVTGAYATRFLTQTVGDVSFWASTASGTADAAITWQENGRIAQSGVATLGGASATPALKVVPDATPSTQRHVLITAGAAAGNPTLGVSGGILAISVSVAITGVVSTSGYTVAGLPAGTVGDRAYVTDALAPAYGVAVAGGGAVTIPVFYNGAAWICA